MPNSNVFPLHDKNCTGVIMECKTVKTDDGVLFHAAKYW